MIIIIKQITIITKILPMIMEIVPNTITITMISNIIYIVFIIFPLPKYFLSQSHN